MNSYKMFNVNFPKAAANVFWMATVLLMLYGNPARANGFVKSKGAHYSKVAATVSKTRRVGSGSTGYSETTQKLGLYSEVGMPLSWPLQLSAFVPYHSIERKSVDFGDGFTSGGFADVMLGMKAAVVTIEIVKAKQFPLTLAVATDLGLTLPTTSKSFRAGNEQSRLNGLDSSGMFLIAPIDRGVTRWSSGIGMSLYSSHGWLSGAVAQTQDFRPDSPEWKAQVALGFSLPMNSWIQFSARRTAAQPSRETTSGIPAPLMFEDKAEAGFGFTVWKGLALEGAYGVSVYRPKDDSPPLREWSAGLSYRSL